MSCGWLSKSNSKSKTKPVPECKNLLTKNIEKDQSYQSSRQTSTSFNDLPIQQYQFLTVDQKCLIDKLQSLSDKFDQNEKPKQELVNKDIVVILGQTGTGKSTILNKLAGVRLVKTNNRYQVENSLEEISKIGDDFNSTTFCINSFTKRVQHQNLYCCDTPGFLDSQGFEGNLINLQVTLNTIYQARSVRFVLLFTPNQYSTQGKGKPFKDLVSQYIQIFSQFQDDKDSILIAFNFIKTSEFKDEMKVALEQLRKLVETLEKNLKQKQQVQVQPIQINGQQMESQFSINQNEMKKEIKFIEMIIQKIESNNCILLDPELQNEDNDTLFRKIYSLKPISKKIQNHVKYSIPQESQLQFEQFLRQQITIFKTCIDLNYLQDALTIVTAFIKLKNQIKEPIIQQQYKVLLAQAKNQEKFDTFFDTFDGFVKIQLYNEIQSQTVATNIRQALNYYHLTETIRYQTKESVAENDFQKITCYIKQQLEKIISILIENSSFEIKFIQLLKLYDILHNQKLQEDFGQISQKLSDMNIPFQNNCLSLSQYENAANYLEEQCHKLWDQIDNLIVNQEQSNDLTLKLKNIYFVIEYTNYNKNLFKNNSIIGYKELQKSIINQIKTLAKSIQDKNFNNAELTKKYKFIQYICQEKNIDIQSNNSDIETQFTQLKELIKNEICQLYKQASNFSAIEQITLIQGQILTLENIDSEISCEVDKNNGIFKQKAKDILESQKSKIQSSCDTFKLLITAFMANQSISIPQNLFQQIKVYVLDILKLKETVLGIGHDYYSIYENSNQQLKDLISNTEAAFKKEIKNQLKLIENYKNIQVLLAIQSGYAAYDNPSAEIKSLIYDQQKSFFLTMNDWIKKMMEQFTQNKQLSFNNYEQLSQQLTHISYYQQFLSDFLPTHLKMVGDIYSKIFEYEKNGCQSIDEQLINKQYIQNLVDMSFIEQLRNDLIEINQIFQDFGQTFYQQFKQIHSFDLENLNKESNYQNFNIVVSVLDQLKDIFGGKYPSITQNFKANLYNIVKDSVRRYITNKKNEINEFQCSSAKEQLELIESIKTMINRISQHNLELKNLDLEKEKENVNQLIQSEGERLEQLLKQGQYKELKEIIEKDKFQKEKLIQQLTKILKSDEDNIISVIKEFCTSPTSDLVSSIILKFNNFQEAIQYFPAVQQKGVLLNKVLTQLKSSVTKIIVNLFSDQISLYSLKITKNPNQNLINDSEEKYKNQISTVAQYFESINKIEQLSKILNQKEIENTYITEIDNNLKEIKEKLLNYIEVDSSKSENICLESVSILQNTQQIMAQLKLSKLLQNKQIVKSQQEIQKLLEKSIIKQSQQYIHSNYCFNNEETQRFMKENFYKIWDFFNISQKNRDKIIKNFIKDQKSQIDETMKNIKSQDPKKIQSAVSKYPDSQLIKNLVSDNLSEIENQIEQNLINRKDSKKGKKELQILKELTNIGLKNDSLGINNCANKVLQNINEKIQNLWKQLENKNLNEIQQMKEQLKLIQQLLNLSKECQIEEAQKLLNESNFINHFKNSLTKLLQNIKSEVENLNSHKLKELFHQLQISFEEKIDIFGVKKNYLMIFQDLTNQSIKCQLITQFEQLSQTFQKFIQEHKRNKLIPQFKQLFQAKQYNKILEMQLNFEKFSQDLNQNQKGESIVQDIQFIFKELEIEYDNWFLKAQKIQNSQEIQLNEVKDISKALTEIESTFQNYSKYIKDKMYSQKMTKVLESQIQLMIKNAECYIDFKKEENKKKFIKALIEIFVIVKDLGLLEAINNFKDLMKKATKDQDMKLVMDLLNLLNQDDKGRLLRDENEDVFRAWMNQLIYQKTAEQNNFKYVSEKLITIQHPQDTQFKIDELQKQFDYCKSINEDINSQIAINKQDKASLTQSILDRAQKFKQNGDYLTAKEIIWSSEQKKELIEILAELSAVWTLIDSQQVDRQSSRFIHAVQIITIMRLLNIDQEQQSQVYNHIAQVKTGEGKSIALGIISTIFALIGFQVDCCCYSDYLSNRDFNDFEAFFFQFQVEKQIQYNTFFKLIEKIVNYPNDHRFVFDNYIYNKQQKLKSQDNNEIKKILVIDEIDFFFGDNFLGEVYAVGYQYRSKEVINLLKFIFQKKYSYLTVENVKTQQEYKDLFAKNPSLNQIKELIDVKIENMIQESRQMEKHNYLLKRKPNSSERVIEYKEIDGVADNISKGYKTSYAYIQEWQWGKISDDQLQQKIALNFNIGCFSYCKIIESYSLILGVTGTLQHMTNFQQQKMKDLCNIQKQTIGPSIYGKSQFKFDSSNDVKILDTQQEQFKKIYQSIQQIIQKDRSVIVFFDNQKTLFEYKQFSEQNGQSNIDILMEQTTDKEAVISKIANYQQIILSTKPFGRGTDFKCYNQSLLDSGGIHAIQTFFSQTLAEEIQIQGRVGRFGSQGSYEMILLKTDLENLFKIKDLNLPNGEKPYQYLLVKRNESLDNSNSLLNQKQNEAENYHKKSIQLKDLLNQQIQQTNFINQLLTEIAVYGDKKDNKISKPSQFYNKIDEQDLQNAKKDKFGNYDDNKFDLGKDGSFKDLTLLIGQFCFPQDFDITNDIQMDLKQSLSQKGFKDFIIAINEKDFIKQSDKADQIWIISGGNGYISQEQNIQKDFIKCILRHLKQRKGLFILSDNYPFYFHANEILNNIPIGYEGKTPVKMQLQGDDPARNILKRGAYNKTLEFIEHPTTQALNEIYEGTTICYPEVQNNNPNNQNDFYDLEIIGKSTTNRPCMFVLNSHRKRGRIVFDCGLTKLLSKNWKNTAGTSKYIQNCYAWLYFMDKEEAL